MLVSNGSHSSTRSRTKSAYFYTTVNIHGKLPLLGYHYRVNRRCISDPKKLTSMKIIIPLKPQSRNRVGVSFTSQESWVKMHERFSHKKPHFRLPGSWLKILACRKESIYSYFRALFSSAVFTTQTPLTLINMAQKIFCAKTHRLCNTVVQIQSF